jgi:hypothetical protein
MTYTAEYWSDGPHVKEFDSLPALASWVQFNGLTLTDQAPNRFGLFRARHADGAPLTADEWKALAVPTATAPIFPAEVRAASRVFHLLDSGQNDGQLATQVPHPPHGDAGSATETQHLTRG